MCISVHHMNIEIVRLIASSSHSLRPILTRQRAGYYCASWPSGGRPFTHLTRHEKRSDIRTKFALDSRRVARAASFMAPVLPPKLRLGRHVRDALANKCPVVALESTVITHGLPEPHNLDLALALEAEIRSITGNSIGGLETTNSNKVTPATVGIVKGQLVIGLTRDEIVYLAKRELSRPIKASRRDISVALARKLSAGTTVAATMAIVSSLSSPSSFGNANSSLSPIMVFATGGTGGVHVGGQESMDISADLYEFARSPLCVVSSGFKSFLDTRRSLEVLETFGCTVMSLRGTRKPTKSPADGDHETEMASRLEQDDCLFPGFFTTTNWQRVKSPCIVKSTREAAEILYHGLKASPLANQRASLLAVPIPEQFALDDKNDPQLRQAMEDIIQIDKRTDLEGKEKTPLILAQLNRATGGKTLRANIELLKNNSKMGAELALHYAEISNGAGIMLSDLQESIESRYNALWLLVCSIGNCLFRSLLARSFLTTTTTEAGRQDTACNKTFCRTFTPRCFFSIPPTDVSPSRKVDSSLVAKVKPLEEREGAVDLAHVRLARSDQSGHNSGTEVEKPSSKVQGPVVVGCTMIDMHVSTKMDDRFKVSVAIPLH